MKTVRSLTLISLFIVLSFGIKAQTEKEITTLKISFVNATEKADSLDFQKQYFDAFPKTFLAFRNTFGYFENKDPKQSYAGALSAEAEKHISLFFRLRNVPDAEFYTKLINLGIGAQWHVEAENHLQIGLRKKVIQNAQLTFELLKNETDKDVESFWMFFYGGQYETYKEVPEKLKVLKTANEREYKLMEIGFQAALKSNPH